MARNKLEHTVFHQEEYDRPESSEEWRQRAVEPFIHHLMDQNPDLASEIASMGQPETDLTHISWMDDQGERSNAHQVRHTLEPSAAERQIFDSFKDCRDMLDPIQREYASDSIAQALTHRATSTVEEYLPQKHVHYQRDDGTHIPFGKTYDNVMNTARTHFDNALQAARDDAASALAEGTIEDLSTAVQDIRQIEKDAAYTATTGGLPDHRSLYGAGQEYYEAVRDRTYVITNALNSYVNDKHPELTPSPYNEEYSKLFEQYMAQFTPADQEWTARKIAGDSAAKQTLHMEDGMAADYTYANCYRDVLLNLKPDIAPATIEP